MNGDHIYENYLKSWLTTSSVFHTFELALAYYVTAEVDHHVGNT